MEKVDLLVSAPHFFTMNGDGVGYRPNSAMAIDRGKILSIGPREEIINLYRGHRSIDADFYRLCLTPGTGDENHTEHQTPNNEQQTFSHSYLLPSIPLTC